MYDDKNCKKDETSYSYELRNKSTSIFHMILVDSICKTIENCNTFILIKSQNSSILEETYSPWIYLEVETVNRIKPDYIFNFEHCSFKNDVSFPLKLNGFEEINSINELIRKTIKNSN